MKVKDVKEKYAEFTNVKKEDFDELLKALQLVTDDKANNAQILCHGLGEKGHKNLNRILDETGLKIANRGGPNDEVSRGLLSTNALANDKDNNVNSNYVIGYTANVRNEAGEYVTIISAIPTKMKDFILGRIIADGKNKEYNCVLDDLGIGDLPKEFILGIIKRKGETDIKFKLNNNFYKLSEKNFNNALDSIEKLFGGEKGQKDYFDDISSKIEYAELKKEHGVPDNGKIRDYEIDALKRYKDFSMEKLRSELLN